MITLAFAASTALAAPDPSGTWSVQSDKIEPSTLTLERDGAGFHATRTDGHSTSEGIALAWGNELAVALGPSGTPLVLLSYHQKGNVLEGQWVGSSGGELGVERIRLRGGQIAGVHKVKGSGPDGTTYKGTVTIDPSADGASWNMTWHLGLLTYSGPALTWPSGLLAAPRLTPGGGDVHSYVLGGCYVLEDACDGDLVVERSGAGQAGTLHLKR